MNPTTQREPPMPKYSLQPENFPEVFFRIIDQEPLKVARATFESQREAESLRFKFYGFRRALSSGGKAYEPRLRKAESFTLRLETRVSPQNQLQYVLIFEPMQRLAAKLEARVEFLEGDEESSGLGRSLLEAQGDLALDEILKRRG